MDVEDNAPTSVHDDATTHQRERSPHSAPAKPNVSSQSKSKATRSDPPESGDQDAEAKRFKAHPPPLDPDDAKLRGWEEVDLGGAGDCFFRCVAFLDALYSSKGRIDAKKATTEGVWFRAQAKMHAEHHADRFEALFKDEQSVKSWLKAAGKQATYAEGALIQASVEKTGSKIIWRYKDSAWERYVLAARFSKGRACWARKAVPHTVVLKDKHYTVLISSKETGANIPDSWLKETPSFCVYWRHTPR